MQLHNAGLSLSASNWCTSICSMIVLKARAKIKKEQSHKRVPIFKVGTGQMHNIRDGICSTSVPLICILVGVNAEVDSLFYLVHDQPLKALRECRELMLLDDSHSGTKLLKSLERG